MSRYRIIPVAAALGLVATAFTGLGTAVAGSPDLLAVSRAELAQAVLDDSGTALLESHVGGQDHAASTASQNIADTAAGGSATTSPWSDVGETSVNLSTNTLSGLGTLGGTYEFRVTTVAGGDHSSTSHHYDGTAFDVDEINGNPVDASNPDWEAFLSKCEELGAVETLGPGDEGHGTHVHCAWSE